MCNKRGGKWTPLREKVLRLLLESGRPAKPYDVLQYLRDDGSAKAPSLYRSLDFLVEMGLIHRIESLDAFVACGHWSHGHSAVFLICEGCGSAAELHASDSVKKLTQDVEAVDFKVFRAVIEVRGLCQACR